MRSFAPEQKRWLGWLFAWTLTVVADLVLFVLWMSSDLDENCDDVGQAGCNEALRNAWPAGFVVMAVITGTIAVMLFRASRDR